MQSLVRTLSTNGKQLAEVQRKSLSLRLHDRLGSSGESHRAQPEKRVRSRPDRRESKNKRQASGPRQGANNNKPLERRRRTPQNDDKLRSKTYVAPNIDWTTLEALDTQRPFLHSKQEQEAVDPVLAEQERGAGHYTHLLNQESIVAQLIALNPSYSTSQKETILAHLAKAVPSTVS
ncbi:hypothetical protein BZG36_05168 [Bifiguratus adelaidae]|uniref:Uncharacterized protein n=1 Tax=Bifiguratus adelaidae TaxID=1938954 RepID=A0A261XTY0_9FUNG|nr:hypothetical protein BZG36_05168 [Bifiguratus adelaidae]